MMTYNGRMRNPLLVLLLCFATFGAYGVYWYWQVNEELRARGQPVRPAVAALAVSWGMLLIVPALVSCFNTAKRVRNVRGDDGPSDPGTTIAMVLLVYPAYLQWHMNRLPAGSVAAVSSA
jgi:hypothetical protein